jgi:hypothetical protein
MKNKIFALLFIVSVGCMKAEDDAAHLAVALAQFGTEIYVADQKNQSRLPSQKNFIKQLCWLFEHNPLFFKLDEYQKNMDYYIAILTNHIKTLELKIARKQNRLKSNGMMTGLATSGLSALCAYASYFTFSKRNAQSTETALYLGGRNQFRQDMMTLTVGAGLASVCFAAVASRKFYKMLRYQQRMVERLARDKQFLAILNEEKELSASKKIDAVTETAIANVVNGVLVAMDSVVKHTLSTCSKESSCASIS